MIESSHSFVTRHMAYHLRPAHRELHDLLAHETCSAHRQGLVSGHARADCAECARHDKVRAVWQRRQQELIAALIVYGDEYDGSGVAGEGAICELLYELAKAADIELEL